MFRISKPASRLLSLLLAVIMVIGMLPVSAFAATTAVTEVTGGQKYLLVSNGYALGYNSTATNKVEAVAYTDSTAITDALLWEAEVDGNGFTLKNGSNYLSRSSSTLQISTSSGSVWTYSAESDETYLSTPGSSTYYLYCSTGSDPIQFKFSTNKTGNSSRALQLLTVVTSEEGGEGGIGGNTGTGDGTVEDEDDNTTTNGRVFTKITTDQIVNYRGTTTPIVIVGKGSNNTYYALVNPNKDKTEVNKAQVTVDNDTITIPADSTIVVDDILWTVGTPTGTQTEGSTTNAGEDDQFYTFTNNGYYLGRRNSNNTEYAKVSNTESDPTQTTGKYYGFDVKNNTIGTYSGGGDFYGLFYKDSNNAFRFSKTESDHNNDVTFYVQQNATVPDTVAVAGVSLDKDTASVEEGKTVTLTETVAPSAATNKNVSWQSSDESVATVADGVVTGVKAGTATITVTTADGGKTATCAVTVTAKTVPSGDAVYIAFSSDAHNSSSSTTGGSAARVNTWLKNVNSKINSTFEIMAFCGDTGTANTNNATTFWSYVKAVMDNVDASSYITGVEGVKGFFVNGNHEHSNGSYSSNVLTNDTAKKIKAVGSVINTDDYAIYSFGASSSDQKNTGFKGTATSGDIGTLNSWLSQNATGANADKPIFIVSHFPIHQNSSRYSANAQTLLDVLNNYPNVIFLWGHNHTDSDPHYDTVYQSGAKLAIGQNGTNTQEFKFTYLSAGCMSDSEYSNGSASVDGKGLVAKVDGNKVTFTYYTENGTQAKTPVTITLGDNTDNGGNDNEGGSGDQVTTEDVNITSKKTKDGGATASATIEVGQELTINLTNGSSSNPKSYAVTVNNSNAQVTSSTSFTLTASASTAITVKGLAAGTATIKMTGTGSGDEYSATVNLNVVAKGTTPDQPGGEESETPAGDQYLIISNGYVLTSKEGEGYQNTGSSSSQKFNYTGFSGVEYTEGMEVSSDMLWTKVETDGGYYIMQNGKYLNATYTQNTTTGYDGVLKLDATEDVWISGTGSNAGKLKSTNASNNKGGTNGAAKEMWLTYNTNLFSVRSTSNATTVEFKEYSNGSGGGTNPETPTTGNTYKLDTDGVATGENYLIVSAGSGTAYALRNNNGTVASAQVTIKDGKIVTDATDIVWTYDSGNFLSNNGSYLYVTNNELKISSSTQRELSIEANSAGSGAYTVKRTDYGHSLNFNNGTWGSSSTATPVYFFVVTTETAHAHTLAKQDGQAATCGAAGWNDYYQCSDTTCNALFADAEGNTAIDNLGAWKTGAGKLDKQAHTYGNAVVTWNDGYETAKVTVTCSECDATADGHTKETTATAVKSEVKATCQVKGSVTYKVEGTFEGKNYEKTNTITGDFGAHDLNPVAKKDSTCAATGTQAYWSCKTENCGKHFSDADAQNAINLETWLTGAGLIAKKDHSYGNAVVTWNDGYETAKVTVTCSECDATADGHTKETTATAVKSEVKATCQVKGSVTYKVEGTFEGKNYEKTNTITGDFGAHDLDPVAKKDSTCAATGTQAYWSCKTENCGKHFSDANAQNEINLETWLTGAGLIAKKDHSYGNADVTWNEGYETAKVTVTCSECDATADGHTKETTAIANKTEVPATCQIKGSVTYKVEGTFEGKKYEKTQVVDGNYGDHTYAEALTENGDQHYYQCTADGCIAISGLANHDFTNNACECGAKKDAVDTGIAIAPSVEDDESDIIPAEVSATTEVEQTLTVTVYNDSNEARDYTINADDQYVDITVNTAARAISKTLTVPAKSTGSFTITANAATEETIITLESEGTEASIVLTVNAKSEETVAWVKATSLEAGKEYLIVGKSGNSYYALANNDSKKVSVTISGDTVVLTEANEEIAKWTTAVTSGNQTIGGGFTLSNNNTFLGRNNTWDVVFYSATSAAGERKVGFDYENGYLFNTSNGSGSSTTPFYLQYSNDKFAFVYQNQEQNITLYVKSTVSGGETPEQPGQPDQPGSGDDDTVDGSFPVASTLTTGRYVIAINNYAMTATHGSTEVENNYWGSTTTTTYPGLEAAQVEMEGTNIVGGVTKSMVWDVKVDGSNITIMNESTETYLDATYSTNGNTRELELVSTGYDTWLYSDSALYTTKTSTAAYIALLNDELFSVRGSSNKGVVKFYSVGNATVDPDEPGQGGEQPEEPEIPDTPVVPGTGSNIGFTSDVHDKTTDLETWLTNVQSKVDPDLERMAFGGDFTYNRSITSFNNAVSIVNKLVGQDKGVYTTGNHEYDNSSVATQMANTKGFVRAGLAVDATNYKIYNIGAYTGDGTGSFQVSDINALDAYLDTAPTNVPIFVVSHYPLHYHSWRTIGNAQMMIEKLNEHPNVVFVWGHNHSQSDPNYGKIQTAAKNNSIEYASGTTAKINFTYLSAGAMYGNAGSYYGMVASVSASGDAVTFQYYDLKGNTVGDAVTVRYATHAHTIKSVAASEATCTEKGMAAHYYCDCGKYFSNAEGTTEVTKASLETPMAAHDWDTEKYTWEKNGNSWTCTAERTCKNSNHTTPETATATVTSKVATPATCVEMGTTTYTATFSVDWADQQTKDVEDIATIAHDYTDSYVDNENDANHTAKCECGDDITENHSYVSGKCVCGATKVEEEKEFTKVSAPTSGKEYVIVINGYGMGATKTDFTDQSNSYVALEGTAVTIADTNAGKKITSDVRDDMFWQVNITGTKYEIKNVKNGTYLNCEYDGSSNRKLTLVSTPNSDWSYSDNHLVNSDHNNGAYLSLFDTKFSVRSNYWMETYPERFVVEFYEVGAVCEHTNKEDLKAVEATCTTTGLTAGKKCSDCGAIIVAQTEVAMKDHDWGTVEYTWTKNGNSWTCTAEHTCANSNHTTPETATATVTSKVATPATCDKMGTTTYTATFSVDWATQQTKDVEDIATIAHDYTDSYVDNENDANHTAKCECGAEITENHSYVSGKCVCGATKVEEEKEFTKVPTPTSGQDYVIVIDDEAMRGIVAEDTNRSDNNANYIYSGLKAAKVTVVSEKITSDVTADMIWTVTKNGNNYTIQNKSTGKYLNAEYYEESGSPKITRYRKLTLVDSNYDTWTYSNNYLGSSDNSNNCYLSAVNSVFSVRSDANSETRRTVYFFEVGSGTVTPDPEPATLSSIAVAKQPTKTVYTEGENFDPAGMEITATYSNDTTKVVTDDVTYDDQKLTVNTKIVTVSYTEGGVTKTATVDITVKAKTPSGSSETIYVAFSSDVHNNGSASSSNTSAYRLNTWLNNVSAAIDSTFVNMAFCGDNGNAGTSGQSYWNNVQYVMDVVTNSDKVATNGIFANGNHEFQNGNQSSTQTNATAKAIKSSGYNEVYSNYAIYVLGAESGTQEFTKGALENLKSWLAQNAADGKPVFIISHYPIHFNQGQWNRTSGNAATLVEYLNPYPNVVFLWGHNHTERDPHYQEIYTAGTELQLTSSSSSKVTINFTYAAAGCMAGSEYNTASESISAKGLVAKITDGKLVSLTQYKADGTALDSQVFDGTDTPVVPDPTPDPEPVEGSYKKVNAPIADKKYAVVIEGYAMTNGTDGFTDSNNSNTAYETLKGTQVTITGEYITSDVTNSMLWQVVVNSNGQMALQNVETGEYLYGEYNDNGSRILKTVSGDAVYAWSYDSNNDYLTNSDKTSDGGATYLSTYNSNNDNNKFCLRSDYHITNNNGTNAKYYKVYFYEYAESTSTHKPTYVGKQDSTCTETGMEAHYYCADCGKYFSNAAGENEVTKDSLVIEAKGHSWKATEKDYKWSADFTKCTVTGVCENDATHTNPVTVNSTSSVKTPADCQTAKVTTYIVTFNLDWATTQKQDVTGEKDPNTHAKNTFEYTDKNNGKHEKAYECCGAIAATEDHDYSETTHNCVCGNIEKFTVTWVVDSKTVKTEEVAYGATIKVPANEPTKDADGCTEYEFVKWTGYTANMTMPAEDVTFTAEFDAVTEHNFENGECVDCGAADPNYKPAGLLGDADGNGYVNNRDAMIIAQYVVGGLAENQKIYLDLADVDGNGYVNNRDAMYIARYVIGDISVFPAQKQSV